MGRLDSMCEEVGTPVWNTMLCMRRNILLLLRLEQILQSSPRLKFCLLSFSSTEQSGAEDVGDVRVDILKNWNSRNIHS